MTELLTPSGSGPNGETDVPQPSADSADGPNGTLEPGSTGFREAHFEATDQLDGETGVSSPVSMGAKEDRTDSPITPVMGEVAILGSEVIPSGIRSHNDAQIVAMPRNTLNSSWPGRDEAAETWLRAYRSPHTRDAYRRDIQYWFGWLDLYSVDAIEARRGDVDAFRSEMEDAEQPPSSETIRRRLAGVSSFYLYWIDDGALVYNPAAARRGSRPARRVTPGSIALTLAHARQLTTYVDSFASHDRRPSVIVRLLLETGVRVSELCGAQVDDLGVTSGHRTLKITRKGGIEAVTALLPATAHALDLYLDGRTEGPLVATSGSRLGAPGPLDRGYVRDLLRRLAAEAGLPLEIVERMHPHVLRHTMATLLDEAGVPMQRIQRQLGHADIRQTELYAGHRQELEASPVYTFGGLLAA